MQQSPQMFPMIPSIPPGNITTEQIQKYLDENKKLIMAIMENQNLGKLAECAQYQALLQKNLMYLAAIADAQPPPPTPGGGASPAPPMASQMTTPHPAMQPPGYYMQAPGMTPQQQGSSPAGGIGIFPPRGPLQFGNSPHQLQDPQQQQQQMHQQAMQMGIRPMSLNNNGMMQHPSMQQQQQQQPETTGLAGGSSSGGGPNVGLRGNKQDGAGDGQGQGQGQGKDDGK